MYMVRLWDANDLDWDFSEPDSVLLSSNAEDLATAVTIEQLEEISDSGEDKFIWLDEECHELVQIGCATAEDMLQEYKENWDL